MVSIYIHRLGRIRITCFNAESMRQYMEIVSNADITREIQLMMCQRGNDANWQNLDMKNKLIDLIFKALQITTDKLIVQEQLLVQYVRKYRADLILASNRHNNNSDGPQYSSVKKKVELKPEEASSSQSLICTGISLWDEDGYDEEGLKVIFHAKMPVRYIDSTEEHTFHHCIVSVFAEKQSFGLLIKLHDSDSRKDITVRWFDADIINSKDRERELLCRKYMDQYVLQ